jgi:ribosomal-protein-alanine N-acetyltransferase
MQINGIIGHYMIKPEHYRAEMDICYSQIPWKGIVSEAVKEVVKYGLR